jgi:hypothetical protein
MTASNVCFKYMVISIVFQSPCGRFFLSVPLNVATLYWQFIVALSWLLFERPPRF